MKKIKRGTAEFQKDKPAPEQAEHPRGSLRLFRLGEGLPSITALQEELQDYTDVLLGRVEPPVRLRDRTLALMECADAYYSRASEIKMLIHKLEREGRVSRGDPLYVFRTGELATFLELSKRAADLGSRRLTDEQLDFEMQTKGRESGGN